MKVEVTSQSGISFEVELTEEERENIKEDLESNLEKLIDQTGNRDTDKFLREIKNIL